MDIYHLGGVTTTSLDSIIAYILGGLTLLSIAGIKPLIKKKKIDMEWNMAALILIFTAIMLTGFGVAHDSNAKTAADNKIFVEKLKHDYGVTTATNLQNIEKAARYNRVIVFNSSEESYKVSPHLDDGKLTFFRVDNGAEIKPKL